MLNDRFLKLQSVKIDDILINYYISRRTFYRFIPSYLSRNSSFSSTYKLRASSGDAKSVQGDTGHAKADTLLNTYSHIEDERRANLTMIIAKDFYGEDVVDEVLSNDKEIDDDIIKRITSNPELQKRTLAALLSNLG